MLVLVAMLYLELDCMPCRDIIRQKRLLYIYYILNQNPESMIYRLFEAQRKNRTSKDWVSTILQDMEEIKMNMRFDDIKRMQKGTYINLVKASIQNHVWPSSTPTSTSSRVEWLYSQHPQPPSHPPTGEVRNSSTPTSTSTRVEWLYSQHPQPPSHPATQLPTHQPEKYGMTSGMKHTTPTSTPSFL